MVEPACLSHQCRSSGTSRLDKQHREETPHLNARGQLTSENVGRSGEKGKREEGPELPKRRELR